MCHTWIFSAAELFIKHSSFLFTRLFVIHDMINIADDDVIQKWNEYGLNRSPKIMCAEFGFIGDGWTISTCLYCVLALALFISKFEEKPIGRFWRSQFRKIGCQNRLWKWNRHHIMRKYIYGKEVTRNEIEMTERSFAITPQTNCILTHTSITATVTIGRMLSSSSAAATTRWIKKPRKSQLNKFAASKMNLHMIETVSSMPKQT